MANASKSLTSKSNPQRHRRVRLKREQSSPQRQSQSIDELRALAGTTPDVGHLRRARAQYYNKSASSRDEGTASKMPYVSESTVSVREVREADPKSTRVERVKRHERRSRHRHNAEGEQSSEEKRRRRRRRHSTGDKVYVYRAAEEEHRRNAPTETDRPLESLVSQLKLRRAEMTERNPVGSERWRSPAKIKYDEDIEKQGRAGIRVASSKVWIIVVSLLALILTICGLKEYVPTNTRSTQQARKPSKAELDNQARTYAFSSPKVVRRAITCRGTSLQDSEYQHPSNGPKAV
ncbi:MAG: hypothetical protein M1825_000752 [Sarcosagium campestre]|nr:MAG: hypothetical protein M1825_000752 [Sarcosagium campestre]